MARPRPPPAPSMMRLSRKARSPFLAVRSLLALNGSANRFRQLGELGLELSTGLQNLCEVRGLHPQGIDWFQ